jgi:hypothetical protein
MSVTCCLVATVVRCCLVATVVRCWEERRLMVFENMVLRETCGAEGV